jgi:hypothetical protein
MTVAILVLSYKNRFGACDMQPAALPAKSVMQQAVLAACMIDKYLNATEQYFACSPK